MRVIKSILFYLFISIWGAIIPIMYFPAFITRSRKLADHGAKIWSLGLTFILNNLCQIDYRVIGLDKLPNEPFIVACKHQSMWETAIMHLIFNRPAYAYKKELLKIPFYGWFVKIMTGIKVDRQGKMSAIKDLIKQSKKFLEEGHKIIIFPQGTRVPTGKNSQEYPYQPGIAAMYLSCNVKVVPAALNSGLFWPKSGLISKKGTITIEFLEPIATGLNKKQFMAELERKIEINSNKLLNNH